MKSVILCSLVVFVMGIDNSSFAVDLLSSFEPNEVGCLDVITRPSKDPTLVVNWPVTGGVNDVPEATEGEHVLKMQWTNETDRKVEIGLWFCNPFDFAGFDYILIDVFIKSDCSSLPKIAGIWDDVFGWLSVECVPLATDDWFTLLMYVGRDDLQKLRNLNHIFAFLFENMAGPSGTVYIDNLRLGSRSDITRRTIRFADYNWLVKDSGCGSLDPGNNYWSDREKNVWVDVDGYLHLKIANRCGEWFCSEVICDTPLGGYGKYIFTADGRLDLFDPNVVLGLFIYDVPDANDQPREIDIEFSRWWNPNEPNIAQYVVHPWQNPGNSVRFKVDCAVNDITTHEIIWTPQRVEFRSYFGDYPLSDPCDLIHAWSYTGLDIPKPANERARMNIWLLPPKGSPPGTPGGPPTDGQEAEIVIKNFLFLSENGICGDPNHPFPVGDLNLDCRVNLLDLAILSSHWLDCTAPICDQCFPSSHPDYAKWVAVGRPDCWCCPIQCHGDSNCDGVVDDRDLKPIVPLIGATYPDLRFNPCFDFDHDGCINSVDLQILTAFYGLRPPADCLQP